MALPRQDNGPKRPVLAPPRAATALGGAGPRASASTQESMDRYLAEIRSTPVLNADGEKALGRAIRESREQLRGELAAIRGAAADFVDACQELSLAGRVPSQLSERSWTEPDEEKHWSDTYEALVREIERARPRPKQIAMLFTELEPETFWMIEWSRRAELWLRPPRALDETRVGLSRAEFRNKIGRAAEHREAWLEARSRFVQHNLRLVVHMAKGFRYSAVPFPDLIQEGNLGLVRAVEKFDDRKGFRFSTYASWWIQQSFMRCLYRDARVVRLPSTLQQTLNKARQVEADLRNRLAREPRPEEVADALGLELKDLEAMEEHRADAAPLDSGPDDDDGWSVADRLADDRPGQGVELDLARMRPRVRHLLGRLDPRSRQILNERFGIGVDRPRSLQEVADVLGISRERVRQIEKRTLALLRAPAKEVGLSELL